MKPKVYLAGPISGLSYKGATDWREHAIAWLNGWGIDAFSPLRAKSYLSGEEKIDGGPGAYARVHPLSTPKGICTRDRWDVSHAGVVLMNLLGAQRISIGSMIEVGWADAFRVPIVVVIEPDDDGHEARGDLVGKAADAAARGAVSNPHHHAMLDQLAGYLVPDLESGLQLVRALVLP